MSKAIEIKGRLNVEAKQFAKFKKLKAEQAALVKAIKAMQAKFNLPEATVENVGTYLIVNGNGDEMGKMSIFARGEFMMPACTIAKVS